MKLTLQHLKNNPDKKVRFDGKKVRIWSGQWRSWWGPNGSGYSQEIEHAGIYTFEQAWKSTVGCGPEKEIEFHTVDQELQYPEVFCRYCLAPLQPWLRTWVKPWMNIVTNKDTIEMKCEKCGSKHKITRIVKVEYEAEYVPDSPAVP